jgi:hypothetical protein
VSNYDLEAIEWEQRNKIYFIADAWEEHYQPIFSRFPTAEEFAYATIANLGQAISLVQLAAGDLDVINHAAHWLSRGIMFNNIKKLVSEGYLPQ